MCLLYPNVASQKSILKGILGDYPCCQLLVMACSLSAAGATALKSGSNQRITAYLQ